MTAYPDAAGHRNVETSIAAAHCLTPKLGRLQRMAQTAGIMVGHAPYMTTLKNGDIAVYRSQGSAPERIPVTGGFAEVSDRGLTVLAESVGDTAAA